MASKTIKGLTVEIDGKVDGLGKALQSVEKQSRNLSKELTDINRLLKFDPSNVEGLTQKKENLARAIDACAEKLRILEDAEKQVRVQFEKGEVAEEQYNALKREIALTTAKLEGFEKQLKGTYKALDKMGETSEDVVTAIKEMDEATEAAKSDSEKLAESLAEVEEETDKLTKELKEIDKLLKDNGDSTEMLTQKQTVLREVIESLVAELQLLIQKQAELQRQFNETGEGADQIREVERAIYETRTEMSKYLESLEDACDKLDELEREADEAAEDLDDLGDEADDAAAEVDDLGDALDDANAEIDNLGDSADDAADELDDLDDKADDAGDETEDLGKKAEKAGDGFTVLKGAISNLISEALQELVELLKEASKYMVQTGMDFEYTMDKVQALLDPTERTTENMAELTEKAMEMGAKTKFSALESAEAMTYLAQAGWKTEDIMAGLDGVMNLAATDGVDLATAAEITAQAINALGYEATDASKFADILAVTAAETCTDVTEMGYAFEYIGPVAGALGFEMEDLAIAIGAMANSGLEGEKAGTALRSLLTNMAKPTDAMAEAMDEYGISLTDANGNMLPLVDILYQLRGAFEGLSEEQKAELAATLAGKTGMAGLLAIVNQSPEEFRKLSDAIFGAGGAAQEMADIMQDNLTGDVEKLGGAFDTLSIMLTDKFNGALREGVQALTAFLDGEATLAETLPRLGGALSQAMEVFRGFLPQLRQMGVDLLNYLVNGLVTGLPILMQKATELVANFCSTIAANAGRIMEVAGSLLTSFVEGIFNFIPTLITGAAEIVGSLARGISENAQNFVSKGLDLLDGFADKLTVALPKLIENGMAFIKNLVVGLMRALPEFISRAPEIISKFANLINDNFPKILKKGVEIIWELIKGIVKAIPTLVKNIPKIIKAIVDVWEAFNWLNLGKTALRAVGNGIKSLWGWLKGIGSSTMNTITTAIKSLPTRLFTLAKQGVGNLGQALRNGWSVIKSAASSLLNSTVNFFKTLPSKLLQVGKDLVKGLWNGISDMTGWVINKIEGFGESVLGGIKRFFGIESPSKEFAKIGRYLDQGLAKGLLDYADDPVKAAQEMATSVLDGASVDGLSLERDMQRRTTQHAMSVTTVADSSMLSKLDKILTAIERGQVIALDGKQLVGGTATAYDSALGQRRMLAARGAL